MRGDRLREILGELRDLVERAQSSLDDRPVLQAAIEALRAKVAEAEAKDEKDDEDEDEEAEPC